MGFLFFTHDTELRVCAFSGRVVLGHHHNHIARHAYADAIGSVAVRCSNLQMSDGATRVILQLVYLLHTLARQSQSVDVAPQRLSWRSSTPIAASKHSCEGAREERDVSARQDDIENRIAGAQGALYGLAVSSRLPESSTAESRLMVRRMS
jgi:hypothetical protein